jgi:hypothetical protein
MYTVLFNFDARLKKGDRPGRKDQLEISQKLFLKTYFDLFRMKYVNQTVCNHLDVLHNFRQKDKMKWTDIERQACQRDTLY